MFNSKKGRRKPAVVRLKSEGSSDDDQTNDKDTVMPSVVKKASKAHSSAKPPAKTASKALAPVSFGDEEEVDPVPFKIKKSSASRKMTRGDYNWESAFEKLNGGPQQVEGGYTKEFLKELAESQAKAPANFPRGDDDAMDVVEEIQTDKMSARILDSDEVSAFKKLREERKKKNSAGNYISLTDEPGKPGTESRLVTEDQEVDGEELFDDYKDEKIAFGSKSTADWKEERYKEIKGTLDSLNLGDDNDDEEMEYWERNKLRAAQAVARTRPKKDDLASALLNTPIPSATRLPQIQPSFQRLEMLLSTLKSEAVHAGDMIVTHDSVIDKSTASIVEIEKTISDSSERYNYFQELFGFMGNLSAFLDKKVSAISINFLAKAPEVLALEADILAKSISRYHAVAKLRESFLDFSFGFFTDFQGIDTSSVSEETLTAFQGLIMDASQSSSFPSFLSLYIETDNISEGIQERKKSIFSDVAKQYRDLAQIKANFIAFRERYPADFKRSFAGLSFPAIANMFIRYDLLEWDPFGGVFDFALSKWHQLLEDGELDDPDEAIPILMKTVQKTIFPRVRSSIGALDLFSSTEVVNFIKLLKKLEDYCDLESRPFKLVEVIPLEWTKTLTSEFQYFKSCLNEFGKKYPL
ncbi:hypothetical protein HDU67_006994 [Dinochytrium kinnereticum]|nr:hypothetical protein HDU67_006994 [Dinochytrium kinnereticum]